MTINVAIVGVGNCAKSLVQGVSLYKETGKTDGLMFPMIGGYVPDDIKFVTAFDVDARKVGRPLHEAIRCYPNCAKDLYNNLEDQDVAARVVSRIEDENTCEVYMGQVYDGVSPSMAAKKISDKKRFYVDHNRTWYKDKKGVKKSLLVSVLADHLVDHNVDVLLNYLPVGSQVATEFYIEACLAAGVPFVNCIPVFIVSDPNWQKRIEDAKIPAIGDDMRSQVGASILSQTLQEMFIQRGATVLSHSQINIGGNTDFRNMLDSDRTKSKKISKENVIAAPQEILNNNYDRSNLHAGPSDYVPFMDDEKVAHIRIEAQGFGGAPVSLDCRLSVQDSPNSAGVVIDAIRYLATARKLGIVGPLHGPSAATQKTPPKQLTSPEAYEACKYYAKSNVSKNKTSL